MLRIPGYPAAQEVIQTRTSRTPPRRVVHPVGGNSEWLANFNRSASHLDGFPVDLPLQDAQPIHHRGVSSTPLLLAPVDWRRKDPAARTPAISCRQQPVECPVLSAVDEHDRRFQPP